MPLKIEMFSDARIALDREVAEHPDLIAFLSKQPANEFEIRLANIAHYCEVILDGDYAQMELDKLCEILWRKLRAKRSLVILPH